MTDHYAQRRVLWAEGRHAVADRIEDVSNGFPYAVTYTDRCGLSHPCRHVTHHTCRQQAWACAEALAAHPDTARVRIEDAPRTRRRRKA